MCMKKSIRLRYSGLVVFSSKIFSMFIGLIFTLIATRKLSPSDYGLWGVMMAFASYFILPSRFFTYWAARDVARGFSAAKSMLWLMSGISIPCFIIFLILSPFLASSLEADASLFVLFALQLPLLYIVSGLEAIGYAVKPQVMGYGVGVFEITKLSFCAFFVLVLRWGLAGVIASVVIAYLAQAVTLFLTLRLYITGYFDLKIIRKWFSKVWVPLYQQLPDVPYQLTLILPAMWLGSTYPVALMTVPRVISNVIGYCSFLSVGLSPKLLSGSGGGKDVEVALKMVMMFAIPATLGVVILARPLLYLLGSGYVAATLILLVLSVKEFLATLGSVLLSTLLGTEKVELKRGASFKDYLKSKHCLISTLGLASSTASFLVLAFLILTFFHIGVSYEWLIFTYFLVTLLIIVLPANVYLWFLTYKAIHFKFPVDSMFRCLVASTIMSIAVTITYPSAAFSHKSVLNIIATLFPTVFLGFASYVLILVIIDREARQLVVLAVKELLKPFKGVIGELA